jgi:hypothetical protein
VSRLSQALADIAQATDVRVAELPPLLATRAAFHTLRRCVPTPVRSIYWRTRHEVWRRRGVT